MFGYVLLISVLCLIFGAPAKAQYVPDVLVEALSPKGFRVSIPDEEGVSLFAFHGKINKELENREAGDFSIDIRKAKDGRWTYLQRGARLRIGDKLYYWVNVDYDDGTGTRGYQIDDQVFTVTDFVTNGEPTPSSTTTTTARPTVPTRKQTTMAPVSETPGCKRTPTMVKGKHSCQGKLIFQDNFANLAKDKWQPTIKFAGDPDYEFVVYENNAANLYTKNNNLHIKPTLLEAKYGQGAVSNSQGLNLGVNCTGLPDTVECFVKPQAWLVLPPVISAQVTTKDHFSFLYGVVEIRAKLPKGDWIYPELHLSSRSDDYGSGIDSGLIRIAFTPGNSEVSKHLYGGCVLGQSTPARNYGLKSIRSENQWNDDFHVFRVEWKTDSITLIVDNHVYGNVYPPEGGFASEAQELELTPEVVERWAKGTSLAPFDKEMYLTLGVGVGGQCFANRDDGTKPWDNDDPKSQLTFYRAQDAWSRTWHDDSALLVDYVKVWAL